MRPFPTPSRRSLWRLLLAVLLTVLGTVSAHAQQPPPPQMQQGPPMVRSIDVEYTGPATVAKERILAQLRTQVGQPYSDAVVEQDIRQLYSTGAVRNVRIFAQPQGDGVKVIVAIQTRSIVREIEVEGTHKLPAKRIRKDLAIKINAPVNEEDLEKGRQKILETYKARGFNQVSVTYRVDPIDESHGTARVVVTVNEGIRGAVKKVVFEGNQHYSDSVLRKQMKVKGQTMFAFIDKSGRLDEVQLQQDIESIKEYYQNHGYIDVEVKDVREENQNGPITIKIAISEGPQYHVNKLSFSGYHLTTEEKLRAVIKMKEGKVYSPKGLHDDAKAIADAYGAGGYVDLVVVPEGSPAGEARIDVHYKMEEGDRSFVQRINIIGNTRTKDKVIRREVLVAPGDVFNTVRVDLSKKRLDNLGYFSKVETFPEDTGVPGRKDLTIQVEEKRTGSLSFGGGFSTVDQLVVFGELSQGNFDITNWPGLTGGGQKFRIRAQVGTQRKDFILALTEPYFLDRRLSLGGQAFFTEADYLSAEYDQRNYGVSFEIRKPINSFMYGSIGYRLENVDIYNISPSASVQIQAENGTTTNSEVLGTLVFDKRDNPLLSRKGTRITISPYVAGGALGGDVQVYGWDLEGAQYFHLPGDLILLFNGEIAAVNVWGNTPETSLVDSGLSDPNNPGHHLFVPVSNVPIWDRLFLGGSNNLRGFAFRDVGPRDASGEPIGGNSMARGTVELTFPIIEKARGALFYDTGFVNADAYDYSVNDQNIASDVGFGIRLDLPVGPMRIDYGIPIQKNGRSGSGHFNFNVGYQF